MQSSAKSLTLEDIIDGRSFICKRKSIRPKTVPCGTPEPTSTRLEDTPSTTTHCLRFFLKLEIHYQMFLSMP